MCIRDSFGAAELVRCVGHCPNLTGLWPQTRIDIVSRRPLENVGSPDLESVQGIDAAVEPAHSPGKLAHGRELASQVFSPAGGEDRLRSLLHHLATVLDPPLRHRYLTDRGQDVCVQLRLALLHRPRLLAPLDAVLEVLLAEHADGARGANISAGWSLFLCAVSYTHLTLPT